MAKIFDPTLIDV